MNKAKLAEIISESVECPKAAAERAVEAAIEAITSTLKSGEEVSIAGLGIFSAKMRAARTARNPRTGEPVQVPAMRVPKFRAAKALKDAVK
jgi:DNA-binding protein HU-beta